MNYKTITHAILAAMTLPLCHAVEHHIEISKDDSKEDLIKKAASITPNKPQLLHHLDEYNAFIHFGPNTFTGVEWGNGKEDPAVFNPETVDTDQWCRILKEAGCRKVVITVKHHDGYNTYQTRYNSEFSVLKSPWKNGKGDVLRLLSDSCKKFGLKLGVYISPADLFQMESATGLYGNQSKYQPTTIPTDPASFKSNPLKARKTDKDLPTFQVEADDYNRYFMNQLYEVLTEYGPIHEVWFDGAHPKRKGGQKYIREEWFKMIRKLAPEAAIFGGPDVRWCGNEHGGTRDTEWNVIPVESLAVSGYDRSSPDIGSDSKVWAPTYDIYGKTYNSNYLYYLIAETDVSIRHGWFWRNDTEQPVLSSDEVFDMYERSVGGNSVLLLNVPPNNKGKFSPRDEKVLLEVGKRISDTYGTNLAEGATSDVEGLFDNDLTTYWQCKEATGSFTVTLPKAQRINRVMIQENIQTVGQRIRAVALDAWVDGKWKEVSKVTTVGYKRIFRFAPVQTDKFQVRILGSRDLPTVSTFSAHYYQTPPPAVQIARNGQGLVEVRTSDNAIPGIKVHYTLDGSEPTADSPTFDKPFALPKGGTIKARSNAGGELGAVKSIHLGISKADWKVISVSSEQAEQWNAAKAIDGNPKTFWQTSWSTNQPHPHSLVVDLGEKTSIKAFTYQPRQDRHVPDGMVESGSFEVSLDGKKWHKAGDFTFGNLLNDPTQRIFELKKPANARYFRFTSKTGAQGKPHAGAAEIGVLSK